LTAKRPLGSLPANLMVSPIRFALFGVLAGAWSSWRLLEGRPYLAAVGWIASLVALWTATWLGRGEVAHTRPQGRNGSRLFAVFVVCLPALVRIASYRLDRIHGDDMLTAAFSSAYALRRDFFAPVPDDPGEWVAQFPSPFFFFQKLFFLAFGESFLTIKLSVLPYVTLTAALLYALASEILDERLAVLAVVVYAFFGPALYLETLGLHFMASTAVFLAFLLSLVVATRTRDPSHALAAGMLAGGCYLFYLSSFIALPLGAAVVLGALVRERDRRAAGNALLFFLGAAAMLAPFVADGFRYGRYFLRRFDQVALLGGEWSPYRHVPGHGQALRAALDQLVLCAKSLCLPGLGGAGGYDFGHQALLAPIVLCLVVLGTVRAIGLGVRRPAWWGVLAVVFVAFVSGMALSMPPPAFHRLSLAFPLLALLAALPLHALLSASRGSRRFRHSIVALVLVAAAVEGMLYFQLAALPETPSSAVRLAAFVNERFPGRPLYVASFPGFAFEKIYRFAPNRRAASVTTRYHKDFLASLDPSRPYVYVMTLPQYFEAEFAARDPRGHVVHFSPEFSVFAN